MNPTFGEKKPTSFYTNTFLMSQLPHPQTNANRHFQLLPPNRLSAPNVMDGVIIVAFTVLFLAVIIKF
jgi:hypothetical protein